MSEPESTDEQQNVMSYDGREKRDYLGKWSDDDVFRTIRLRSCL
jgi:hypothetical protein